ncbi:hypothetical protein CLAFUW4_02963 [Fulvia fulva]|uniref:2EXR domain-containing protein n=1 Tax=Passalora fulva TaxID=5499 RepID=A0A9Q8LA98_PASFU|nr:uncharacterized protein CLAFUR5_02949 [Fulvia fulva]KAK4631153.1 hypothetical protein CLAFUR4_02956 [Fulvia fulva]KAK4632828.1 hypothetical protein CLAFUR0_02959 [Fulvia fulva]UJO13758.1 hypothetical protein CLAFUR5_02949 [Fulvia fulva]WPV10603.1 hypothetical protein CLAFUW4_02963 [Fulvia fulva]WPV26159.1 hypothetical protein CLAFUW7_02960 [Fulvia fulva]
MANNNANGIPHIFRIPAELRNQIWELALVKPNGVDFSCDGHQAKLTSSQHDHPMAIVQTCRQARNEGMGLFYSRNTFTIKTSAFVTEGPERKFYGAERWAEHLWQWVRTVSRLNIKHLKHIIIHCGEWKAQPGPIDKPRSDLAHNPEIHNLLADFSHFFQSVHPECTIDFVTDVT